MASDIHKNAKVAGRINLLSSWIESQMAYHGVPGLSIGIVYDQELVWSKGFGYADLEKKIAASPDTIFRIASITKLFTTTALLQLRDAGKLQLDDPIVTFLPWFEIKNRYPDAPTITLRHILTHTSGLPRDAFFPSWSDADAYFPTREEIREALPEMETILPTETSWKYSNFAMALAGEIVAAVSGQEYVDYIEKNITQPLGMKNTYVRSISPDHPQLAIGYGRLLPDGSRTEAPYSDCQGIAPAASIATTMEDLARFAMLQFRDGPEGGEQILRGSTLREMQRVHWLDPKWRMGWGLGFTVTRQDEKTFIWHHGGVRGYQTQLWICPDEKVAVVVSINADDGEPEAWADKAYQWIAPAILEATASEPQVSEPDPAWKQYIGKYRDPWGDKEVLILDNELVVISPSVPDPLLSLDKLIPVGDHTFRIEAKECMSSPGELAIFEMDGEGKIKGIRMGDFYYSSQAEW